MKNKEKNFISVVVYVRNAEKTIKKFIESINESLSKNFLKYEIILVNDGSIDNSIKMIKEASKKIEKGIICLINMSHYQGKELAINAGVDLAIGDFVYEFETTSIDYPIDTVFDAYKHMLEGYDIVSVTSNAKRRKSSYFFYKIFNRYSNYQYKLDTETFRLLSRRAINRVNAINKTIPYRKAALANCGLKLDFIKYEKTKKIKTNIDKKIKNEREQNALDSLILFTDVSYKITKVFLIILILITISVLGYTIYTFALNNPIAGWTTTMLFLSFGFLGLFLVLSIVLKYLSILVKLVFKKTNYLVESIEKIK